MSLSIEQTFCDLKREVGEARERHAAMFTGRLKHFFAEAKQDFARVMDHVNDVFLRNPPSSLQLSTQFSDQTDSLLVPCFLPDSLTLPILTSHLTSVEAHSKCTSDSVSISDSAEPEMAIESSVVELVSSTITAVNLHDGKFTASEEIENERLPKHLKNGQCECSKHASSICSSCTLDGDYSDAPNNLARKPVFGDCSFPARSVPAHNLGPSQTERNITPIQLKQNYSSIDICVPGESDDCEKATGESNCESSHLGNLKRAHPEPAPVLRGNKRRKNLIKVSESPGSCRLSVLKDDPGPKGSCGFEYKCTINSFNIPVIDIETEEEIKGINSEYMNLVFTSNDECNDVERGNDMSKECPRNIPRLISGSVLVEDRDGNIDAVPQEGAAIECKSHSSKNSETYPQCENFRKPEDSLRAQDGAKPITANFNLNANTSTTKEDFEKGKCTNHQRAVGSSSLDNFKSDGPTNIKDNPLCSEKEIGETNKTLVGVKKSQFVNGNITQANRLLPKKVVFKEGVKFASQLDKEHLSDRTSEIPNRVIEDSYSALKDNGEITRNEAIDSLTVPSIVLSPSSTSGNSTIPLQSAPKILPFSAILDKLNSANPQGSIRDKKQPANASAASFDDMDKDKSHFLPSTVTEEYSLNACGPCDVVLTTDERQAKARSDEISSKIRKILASAPIAKSETRRQIEKIQAERTCTQSGLKIVGAVQLNAPASRSRVSFVYRSQSPGQVQNKSTYLFPGKAGEKNELTPEPTPTAYTDFPSTKQEKGSLDLNGSKAQNSYIQGERGEKVPQKRQFEYNAGSAIMNFVSSVTSLLPNASDIMGLNRSIPKIKEMGVSRNLEHIQRTNFEDENSTKIYAAKDLCTSKEKYNGNRLDLKSDFENRHDCAQNNRRLKQKEFQETVEREEFCFKRQRTEGEADSVVREDLVQSSRREDICDGTDFREQPDVYKTPYVISSKSVHEKPSSYKITPANETLSESSDEQNERRRGKFVPRWARADTLMKSVVIMNNADPDDVFSNATPVCNLTDVFGETQSYRRARSSSVNWAMDK